MESLVVGHIYLALTFSLGRANLQIRCQGESCLRPAVFIAHKRKQMTCTGCSGAVTRVLEKAKLDGEQAP